MPLGNGLLRLIGVSAAGSRGRALSHHRGAAVHHPGEPGRRAAARRVGPHPARAVRVRRPHRGRGDGAARACWSGIRGRAPSRTSCAEIVRAQSAHPLSGLHRRPRPHRRQRAHQGRCCGTSSPDKPVTARDARPLPYVPATDAARRGAGGDAALPRADGGGDGRARRHGRPRHDRRTCSRKSSATSRKGTAAGPIVREAPGRFRVRGTVRLEEAGDALGVHARAPEGADDQRPGAGAARPAGGDGRRGDVEQRADRSDRRRRTRRRRRSRRLEWQLHPAHPAELVLETVVVEREQHAERHQPSPGGSELHYQPNPGTDSRNPTQPSTAERPV